MLDHMLRHTCWAALPSFSTKSSRTSIWHRNMMGRSGAIFLAIGIKLRHLRIVNYNDIGSSLRGGCQRASLIEPEAFRIVDNPLFDL